MTIYGPSLGTLWRLIESYGHDPRRVIGAEVYTPGDRGKAHARISYDTFSRMRSKAAALIGDPAVGIRAADHIHPSHMGPLGHAWLASSTLLDGFRRIERYGRMFNESEHLTLSETAGRYVATIHVPPVDRADEVRDAVAAGLVALCRFNYGPALTPDVVRLRRRPPLVPKPWLDHFRCPVRFGCETDELAFLKAVMLKPLSSADPRISALHDEAIERYLGALDRDDIVGRTRIQIVEQLASGRATEESVAAALNMTKRTLHRKLSDHSSTFRAVLEETRRSLVQRYLEDTSISLTEIAFLLGFADSSSFSRAYRRWFGVPASSTRR